MGGKDVTWVTLQAASSETGFHVETLRGWARVDPEVASRMEGQRRLVALEDVRRRAASAKQRRRLPRTEPRDQAPAVVLDRVATLEEIVRRQRLIDEHREEVERRHLEIAQQYREIAELALGPSVVPDL